MKHENTICIKCNKRWLDGDRPHIIISMCSDCLNSYRLDARKTDDNFADEIVYERLKTQRKFKRVKPFSEYLRKKTSGKQAKNTQDKIGS